MCGFDINDPRINERILGKSRLAFSFLTHMPIVPGHSLVCPIRIVETCEELSLDEWSEILALKHQVCEALKKVFNAEGFNFAWNMGEKAGQSVPHFHLHVVPRKPGDAGHSKMPTPFSGVLHTGTDIISESPLSRSMFLQTSV